jgi:23S rRNA pseudouridine1911/1915/1917 synthase
MTLSQVTITEEHVGLRLDKALAELASLSRTKATNLIKDGHVFINDSPVLDQNHRLEIGDIVKFELKLESKNYTPKASDIPLNIVFEDDDLIVIDKQSGLTVHPGAGNHDDTLVNALVGHYGKTLSSLGGEERPGIVHRLDRDTSGLMVVAKNDQAHAKLSEAIANREVKRVYTALVWGNVSPESGTIKTNIARSNKDRTRMTVVSDPAGKVAITHYVTKRSLGYISILECSLETGRTHQIRVHLSHIGHSVVGDQTYGNNSRKINQYYSGTKKEVLENFKRQALHSSYLEFMHPTNLEIMRFESPLPKDLELIVNSI